MTSSYSGYWSPLIARLRRELKARQKMRVNKQLGLPHPRDSGATRSVGLPDLFKRADWRWTLTDGSSFHVEEYDVHYLVHWDEVCPHRDPVGHFIRDTPVLAAGAVGLILIAVLNLLGGRESPNSYR